jgi:hypothetical protein
VIRWLRGSSEDGRIYIGFDALVIMKHARGTVTLWRSSLFDANIINMKSNALLVAAMRISTCISLGIYI